LGDPTFEPLGEVEGDLLGLVAALAIADVSSVILFCILKQSYLDSRLPYEGFERCPDAVRCFGIVEELVLG